MAHQLKFDPTSPEGAEIVALYNNIRENIQDEEGGWNGADTVDALCTWFDRLGVDVSTSGEPIRTP
ncbi:hypothetical protein ACFW2K_22850 [Streptomyces nigra]|uniref:hypothetical protein n=1 Tax=Streptomyces nigra TaxID=1827580 RepID=UPI00368C60F7